MTPPRSLGPLRRAESSRARAGAQAEELGARIKQLEEEARTIEKDKVCAPRRRFTAKSRVLRRAAFCEEPRSAKSRVLRRAAFCEELHTSLLPRESAMTRCVAARRSRMPRLGAAWQRSRRGWRCCPLPSNPPARHPAVGGTRRVQLLRKEGRDVSS
jgi:hypothetical protein